MADSTPSPGDKAAKREARRQRELDRIAELGRAAAADMPPLTDEQIERIAFILAPTATALAALTRNSAPVTVAPAAEQARRPHAHVRTGDQQDVGRMTADLDLSPETLYTAEEVAHDFLKMRGTWWLEKGAREGRLPCTMLGRSRRYSRDNILAIIAICNTPTTTRAPKSRS